MIGMWRPYCFSSSRICLVAWYPSMIGIWTTRREQEINDSSLKRIKIQVIYNTCHIGKSQSAIYNTPIYGIPLFLLICCHAPTTCNHSLHCDSFGLADIFTFIIIRFIHTMAVMRSLPNDPSVSGDPTGQKITYLKKFKRDEWKITITSQSMKMMSNGGRRRDPLCRRWISAPPPSCPSSSSCMVLRTSSTASLPFPHDSTVAPSRERAAEVRRRSTGLSSAIRTLSPDSGRSLRKGR